MASSTRRSNYTKQRSQSAPRADTITSKSEPSHTRQKSVTFADNVVDSNVKLSTVTTLRNSGPRTFQAYKIYQFNSDSNSFNIKYADVAEHQDAEPTVEISHTCAFASINRLTEKYVSCVVDREKFAYLSASNGVSREFSNETPTNLYEVTLLGVITQKKCTIYVFLQVRKKTNMVRLHAIGSTKIKVFGSTYCPQDSLSKITQENILEVFQSFKQYDIYKNFIKKYEVSRIHLFNSYETINP
jgi:hypothetical protein